MVCSRINSITAVRGSSGGSAHENCTALHDAHAKLRTVVVIVSPDVDWTGIRCPNVDSIGKLLVGHSTNSVKIRGDIELCHAIWGASSGAANPHIAPDAYVTRPRGLGVEQ